MQVDMKVLKVNLPKNGLTVICMTLLCSLWIVLDSQSESSYEDKNVNFLATLAYEVK